MIKVITGNLMDVKEGIIAHGCNAQGVMGSGVAKLIKDRYEELYLVYRNHYLTHRRMHSSLPLGSVSTAKLTQTLYGANLVTQEKYRGFGNDFSNKRWVSYDAIETSFMTLLDMLDNGKLGNIRTISIPMIGAGLGGGDWDVIYSIIENTIKDRNVEVIVYKL
jgi:O-acetyl-ADP-ribose deacetylase (regulator of RNase III)